MTSYKINFEQISQDKKLGNMLRALERGLQKYSIDYYLVGAVSRNVWMSGIHKIAPRRTTSDIDFAVFINDKGVYEQLQDYLIQHEDFQLYKENAFVLIYKDGTEVDLMPFGAVEDENRKVTIEGTGFTSIQVDGFKEVYEQLLPDLNLEGHHFKFCSLPGIVLLKLIAWDDRPEIRRDDIVDISDILQYFFTMYQDIIWDEHNDLFDDQSDLLVIACRVMGREISKITHRSEQLHERIISILTLNSATPIVGKMPYIMREYFDNTVEDCLQLIETLKHGVLDRPA